MSAVNFVVIHCAWTWGWKLAYTEGAYWTAGKNFVVIPNPFLNSDRDLHLPGPFWGLLAFREHR